MITIRGKKHTFNMKVVGKMSYKEFEAHCQNLPLFIQLPEKERNAKIKEAHGNIQAISGKASKARPGQGVRDNDVEPDRGDIRAEQGANDRRKDIGGGKDKAKVQKRSIRKEKGKDEL